VKNKVKIFTLGSFKVVYKGHELKNKSSRSSKRWKLFQYLLTHKQREVSREELIINLDLNDNDDPEGALTALVYRLRKILYNSGIDKNIIKTAGSAYSFSQDIDYYLDVEELEKLCTKAIDMAETDFNKAVKNCRKALQIYKGDYLEGNASEEWVWSARNRYRELIISTLLELDEYYKKHDRCAELLKIYQKLHELIHFDERLIDNYLAVLVENDRKKSAQKKINEIKNIYEKSELQIPEIIGKHESRLKTKDRSSELKLNEDLKDIKNTEGAFFCREKSKFKDLYELEKSRMQRDNNPRCLAQIRLSKNDEEEELESIANNFSNLLLEQLRSGDIVFKWNHRHFVLLLFNINSQESTKVLNRIENSFRAKQNFSQDIVFNIKRYQL